jgi:hypothetical protein
MGIREAGMGERDGDVIRMNLERVGLWKWVFQWRRMGVKKGVGGEGRYVWLKLRGKVARDWVGVVRDGVKNKVKIGRYFGYRNRKGIVPGYPNHRNNTTPNPTYNPHTPPIIPPKNATRSSEHSSLRGAREMQGNLHPPVRAGERGITGYIVKVEMVHKTGWITHVWERLGSPLRVEARVGS